MRSRGPIEIVYAYTLWIVNWEPFGRADRPMCRGQGKTLHHALCRSLEAAGPGHRAESLSEATCGVVDAPRELA